MTQVPVAEGVFTWPADEPQLIGSRCTVCGMVTFPTQDSCPRCGSTAMEDELLARRGRLWAWTIQEFAHPSPPYSGATGDDFEPFGVGYVELPDEVKVETGDGTIYVRYFRTKAGCLAAAKPLLEAREAAEEKKRVEAQKLDKYR